VGFYDTVEPMIQRVPRGLVVDQGFRPTKILSLGRGTFAAMFRFALLFCACGGGSDRQTAADVGRVFQWDAVGIETARADWEADRFRTDWWLYRGDGLGSLVPEGCWYKDVGSFMMCCSGRV